MSTLEIHKEQLITSDLFSDSPLEKQQFNISIFYTITKNNYYKYPKKCW